MKQQMTVIQIAIDYCGNTDDPSNLSDETVKKVLEKAGFKVEIAPSPPQRPLLTTRFSQ